MNDTVIRAEGVGKRFVIGHRVETNGLFVDAMVNATRRFFSKGKSVLKGGSGVAGDTFEEFWALNDVNFEIKRGELVSIIGHNGAGKSTLLKILSRITEPSTGRIEISGRVASLLEVGTGFHPELSGRENIFLNGAILGMTRVEVRQRFDEIVAFAGVSKFIDTPVKRYSVGMYARLAFAVAAHLEAEILIIDEVLAVGDAEFQAKCLDRMSAVASTGRTVLFVSHNLAAVTALTKRALVLNAGKLTFDGPVQSALSHYSAGLSQASQRANWGSGENSTILAADLIDERGAPIQRYTPGSPMRLRVVVEKGEMPGIYVEMRFRDELGLPFGFYSTGLFDQVSMPSGPGKYECVISLGAPLLAAGQYSVDVTTAFTSIAADHDVKSGLRFIVESCSPTASPFNFTQSLGSGPLAMTSTAPVEFKALPAGSTG
jgi:lipopolysaccharide transport system ATP-binding protein